MKTNKIWSLLLMTFAALTFQSCLDDNDNEYVIPNAVVTFKTEDNQFFLQLDDSTRLNPVNVTNSPYGDKEVRALINFSYVNNEKSRMTSKDIHLNFADSIRTKMMSPNYDKDNDRIYGNDPLEIVNDWTTVVEDGYLTLRFRTYFGKYSVHYLNLLPTKNPENPYEVILRHDAKGDIHGEVRDGLIAFRLDKLPSTNGKTVDLTLVWNSFTGYKKTTFKYCSRE